MGAKAATSFTAARQLAYRARQKTRGALEDDAYRSFFDQGIIDDELARELIRAFTPGKPQDTGFRTSESLENPLARALLSSAT